MPELPVKESRLSELHLPEINRDDIMRSLSEIRMPEVDLPDSVTKRDWPKFEMPDIDIGKAVAGAVAAAGIGRRSRPRWPLAVGGLILAGVATAAILSNETIRAKIASGIEALRERVSAMRSTDYDELDIDQDDPIAFDAAATAPIETPRYSDGSTLDATADYPAGLGSNGHEDGIPAFEEPSTTSRS
jgi:hypothetical protein